MLMANAVTFLCCFVLMYFQLAMWLLTAYMDLGALVFAVNGLLLVRLVKKIFLLFVVAH